MWRLFSWCAVVLFACCTSTVLANVRDSQQFIESLRDKSDRLRFQAPPSGIPAHRSPPSLDDAWLNKLKQKQQAILGQQAKPQPKALYFLSFSIPEESLKLMLPEAQQWGIPAVVNGLINNDFRQTAEAVFRLTKEGNNGGVQIDPTQFARFGISSVPALVVVCGEQYDVVRGNIRLRRALELVANRGECADVAQQLLKEGA